MGNSMTVGKPWKLIVFFALPLLAGNIFQAAYNLVDTMVIGRFVGPDALAGLGIASPIFNLINALLIGLSVGSSIIVAQLFGAKKDEELPAAVSTVLLTSLGLSLLLTVIGQFLVTPLLTVLNTPAEDFVYAETYLRVILCGLVCNVFYNQLSGLLRGLGNAKTPLYFLVFSSVMNILLDLLFVLGFGLGVTGAAVATILSQGLSAVLTALYIRRRVPLLRAGRGKPQFDTGFFRTALRFGLPMGFQQASISIGHLLMQAIVNPFGTALIAGYAGAMKVDMFAVMPIISLGTAMSTFSAQNVGCGDYQRVRQGYRVTNGITIAVCVVIGLIVVPLRQVLMGLFVSPADYPQMAEQIIALGMSMLAITPCFYILLGLIHTGLNTMAGAGDTSFSMFAAIFMMLLRIPLALFFIHVCNMDYTGIWWAFPASWVVTLGLVLLRYFQGGWKNKAVEKHRVEQRDSPK